MTTPKKPTIGVLLANLGTPDSPETKDVRRYLRQFLMDGRVIDIPYPLRFLLVQGIIAPLRAPKSAKIYKQLWTAEGSPLKYLGYKVAKLLQEQLDPEVYHVELGMRYQNPSIESAIEKMTKMNVKKIILIPMFPQYASASTGSVLEEVMRIMSEKFIIPELKMVSAYYDHPLFIKAFAEKAKKHLDNDKFDHILMSYHGIPERHLRKGDVGNCCLTDNCCSSIHAGNQYCYKANCYETSRLLAKELNLKESDYTVAFQSRLGRDPWIKPYSDKMIEKMPSEGKNKVLALVPSFVADCLETTVEVGDEYKELFEENGGKHWELVDCINDSPTWIACLKDLVLGESK